MISPDAAASADKEEVRAGQPGVPSVEETRPAIAILLGRFLRPLDNIFNRVYGSEWNPLYKSGTLAVTFLACTLVTGIYLFLPYKVSDPWASVAAMDATWLGSLMRSVHRYSADLAVVAVAIHAVKMLAAGRTWGPRALAWISGLFLLCIMLICGWTGLVMAWDVQGQLVALEGARIMDLLPIFSEPLSRSFSRPESVGRAFFFMNLFLHVALPLGLIGLFWVHSSRVARAPILPPKLIHRYAIGAVVVFSILVPVPLPPAADLLAVPVDVPLDIFYAFWLPLARRVPAWGHLLAWFGVAAVTISVPWWWRPKKAAIRPSRIDESKCAGCTQCYTDCPYEAISMVVRSVPATLSEKVARVDPSLCVGCGLCSGSCAPMSVGPRGRTGRDQLRTVEAFLAARPLTSAEIVLVGCAYGLGEDQRLVGLPGVVSYPSGCSGSVHTSVIELFVRSGAGGVFLLTCPDRDCLYREGPKWLNERVYNDREAELQPRVDKRRVRVASFAASEVGRAVAAVKAFSEEVDALGPVVPESDVRIEIECEVPDDAVA